MRLMNESDILDETKLYNHCASVVTQLALNNSAISKLINKFNKIVDYDNKGKTATALVQQCTNYALILDKMMVANDLDTIDCQTLELELGTERLVGAVILPGMRNSWSNYVSECDSARSARSTADNLSDEHPIQKEYWYSVASYHDSLSRTYKREYDEYKRKYDKFNNINEATKELFKASAEYRKAVDEGLRAIVFNFVDGEYTITGNDSWKKGIEKLDSHEDVVNRIQNGWKDSKGKYDISKLKEMYCKPAEEISHAEQEALDRALKELGEKDCKEVTQYGFKSSSIASLASSVVSKFGLVGSYATTTYKMGDAIAKGDSKAVAKGILNMAKDGIDRFGKLADNAYKDSPNLKKMFVGDFGTIGESVVKNVAPEAAKKASRLDVFKASLVAEKDAYIDVGRGASAIGKNIKVAAKWGGTLLSGVINYSENKVEQSENPRMSDSRVLGETFIETGTDILLGTFVSAGTAAVLGAGAPVVVVGLVGAGVVWGLNEACKQWTKGKDIGEVVADGTYSLGGKIKSLFD